MARQLVDLDLAELADVADALAAEGGEVGRDAGGFEVNDAREGLVEERADGRDGEVAGFGLGCVLVGCAVLAMMGYSRRECGSWP